tara:strand:+ start:8620 stop:11664 length:3045 start_codon:yes stop_codon:yes gene_type:complete
MAEQVFRSPGFFPREIDVPFRAAAPTGPSCGVIGTSLKGPAFAPTLITSFQDFVDKFGKVDGSNFAPLAIREYLANGGTCIFVRLLGAGAVTTQDHINTVNSNGSVKSAGFKLSPSAVTRDAGDSSATGSATKYVAAEGATFFIGADHGEQDSTNYPMLTEAGDTVTRTGAAQFIRAMIFAEANTEIIVADYADNAKDPATFATASAVNNARINSDNLFKIFISSSADSSWATDDSRSGCRVLTASLHPDNANYIDKILNTNPERLGSEKHLLYASFAVDPDVAKTTSKRVAVLSGSGKSNDASVTFLNAYGRFDTRYKTPGSPWVLSQPFGTKEYNLFRIESISDGAWANNKYKISIASLKKSNSRTYQYGSFTLLVRDFYDSDESPAILESFPNLSLDPNSENFIGMRIGDKKLVFDFDQVDENERRVKTEGMYPNISRTIRVVLSADLKEGNVPPETLPCGFKGYELLKFSYSENDTGTNRLVHRSGSTGGESDTEVVLSELDTSGTWLTGCNLPPIPMRVKLTKNEIGTNKEKSDKRLYWGCQFQRVSGSAAKPNKSGKFNTLFDGYSKFLGSRDFDALITGSTADKFNNNKFTLDNVNCKVGTVSDLATGSINDAIKTFVYERDRDFTKTKSMTEVLAQPPSSAGVIDLTFNRLSTVAKFSFFLNGGFDGVDITDSDEAAINDKATSTATNGGANSSYSNASLGADQSGTDLKNAGIQSYRRAIEALSNPDTTDVNLMVTPGIREPLVTDYAADKMRDRFDAFYIMDIEEFDDSSNRLFESDSKKPNIKKTIQKFQERGMDNNFAAAYFPDVVTRDSETGKRIVSPPSVPVLGAFSFNDRVGQPWFAPAGFNRGGLPNVIDVDLRLNFDDRDRLYEAAVNPVASFPREGIVVFGQKTLQATQTALDRVNVRRLLIEVRRSVKAVGNSILFEPNTDATVARFKNLVVPILERIQVQAGIERFKVVMDETNNTIEDKNNNRLNGRIFIVPTKTVEFVAVDFIITEAGVQFE